MTHMTHFLTWISCTRVYIAIIYPPSIYPSGKIRHIRHTSHNECPNMDLLPIKKDRTNAESATTMVSADMRGRRTKFS